jgi:hypothetical protein
LASRHRRGVRDVDVERRDLRHRQHEVVVLREELPALLVHLRLPRKRAADIGGRQAFGLGDFVLDGVLHPLRPLADERRVLVVLSCIAKRRKRLVDAGEVRFGLLHGAAEALEDLSICIDDGANLGFDGNPTQTLPPGDAHAFEGAAPAAPGTSPDLH